MEKQISLKTLPEFTKQEVFEYVVTNLLKQGEKSILPNSVERCGYRGKDGKKCAAGFIISDEEYKKTFEGKTFQAMSVDFFQDGYFGYNERQEKYHFKLIEELQKVHDNYTVSCWIGQFNDLADYFSLDKTFLEAYY